MCEISSEFVVHLRALENIWAWVNLVSLNMDLDLGPSGNLRSACHSSALYTGLGRSGELQAVVSTKLYQR